MQITKNPYQRAAAGCAVIAAVLSIAGAPAFAPIALLVAVVFALVAYARRDDYPRR
jgi:hypothetical protein